METSLSPEMHQAWVEYFSVRSWKKKQQAVLKYHSILFDPLCHLAGAAFSIECFEKVNKQSKDWVRDIVQVHLDLIGTCAVHGIEAAFSNRELHARMRSVRWLTEDDPLYGTSEEDPVSAGLAQFRQTKLRERFMGKLQVGTGIMLVLGALLVICVGAGLGYGSGAVLTLGLILFVRGTYGLYR